MNAETKKTLAKVDAISRAIAVAKSPPEVIEIEAQLAGIEEYLQTAGLYRTDEIRPVNEARMRARWKLGQLLAKEERAKRGPKGKVILTGLKNLAEKLKGWGLTPPTAMFAQRIGTLPPEDLDAELARARKYDTLCTFETLIERARPYWYQANRKRKHRAIADAAGAAAAANVGQMLGPFPLIYADPPWKFQIYSEKGLERTPDQHYPTLTDREIIDFTVGGRPMSEIAAASAALFLWCTSSNMFRAGDVMKAWGFEFKSSAVWDKQKTGLGLVFRNQHEVLLYGTKGSMPGPQFQPASVFSYPRGAHSAKPKEVRAAIEKMYPDFDESSRLELFARETVKGWTAYGFEAARQAAE